MEAKSTRAQFGGVKINRFEPKKKRRKESYKGGAHNLKNQDAKLRTKARSYSRTQFGP